MASATTTKATKATTTKAKATRAKAADPTPTDSVGAEVLPSNMRPDLSADLIGKAESLKADVVAADSNAGVISARVARFRAGVAASHAFGMFIRTELWPLFDRGNLTGDNVWSKGICSKGSGIYVPTAGRGAFGSDASITRYLQMSAFDAPAVVNDYLMVKSDGSTTNPVDPKVMYLWAVAAGHVEPTGSAGQVKATKAQAAKSFDRVDDGGALTYNAAKAKAARPARQVDPAKAKAKADAAAKAARETLGIALDADLSTIGAAPTGVVVPMSVDAARAIVDANGRGAVADLSRLDATKAAAYAELFAAWVVVLSADAPAAESVDVNAGL